MHFSEVNNNAGTHFTIRNVAGGILDFALSEYVLKFQLIVGYTAIIVLTASPTP
jgi:hypothetical protein